MTRQVTVWDWPLRLFHGLLVFTVSGAYITGTLGGEWTQWHERLGLLTLALLLFRLQWGFVGGRFARFSEFMPTPHRLKQYWQGQWQGAGHNPFGALAVFTLLVLLSVIVVSGLFANDDIGFEGPLYALIDKELSDYLSGWHDGLITPLLLLLGLHVAAIGFYRVVKGIDLVKPMLTGQKALDKDTVPDEPVNALLLEAVVVLAIAVPLIISQIG